MRNYRQDFSDFKDKIWLNAASEGPLPKVAALALNTVVEWKSLPYQLDHQRFLLTQKSLKDVIGRLIRVDPQDVILGNSASYGIHLLANGIPWKAGDEIVTMQNDFPTNILPWLALEEQGVKVVQVKAKDRVLTPEELKAHLSPRTRLFCISQVHSFLGYKLDVESFARICREKGVIFVTNVSQSLGSFPVDVSQMGADAVVCAGYKWLCGPYGTGFVWIKPELRRQLKFNQAYWQFMLTEEELQSEEPIKLRELPTARKYDIFATANFFNYAPWRTAIEYWLDVKLENVERFNHQLIDHFISTLDPKKYRLISPKEGPGRSNLIVISHQDASLNAKIHRDLIVQGIYTAFWKGNIRVSPHVYNRTDELTRLCGILNKY